MSFPIDDMKDDRLVRLRLKKLSNCPLFVKYEILNDICYFMVFEAKSIYVT